MTLHGTRPLITGAPVTGVGATRRALNSGANHECRCWLPGLAKLPVSIHSSLLRYEQSVEFGACWTPRSSNTATLSAAAIRRAARADQLLVDAAALRVVADRHLARTSRAPASKPFACSSRNAWSTRSSWTSVPTSAARHHASVPGRTRRWKSASFAVSVSDRVDDDHRALRDPWRSPSARRALAGSSATSTGSCRRRRRPPRARTRRACGRRRAGRRPRPRRSSPGPARSSGSARRPPAGRPRCRSRRGGSPGRRRRSRRSSRRRARRGRGRTRRRSRRSPCPSRSPRTTRPARRRSGDVRRSGPFW